MNNFGWAALYAFLMYVAYTSDHPFGTAIFFNIVVIASVWQYGVSSRAK